MNPWIIAVAVIIAVPILWWALLPPKRADYDDGAG